VYLDASVEERARRRWEDYQVEGSMNTYQDILEAMRRRDSIDSGRKVAPLRPAHDAVIIDTTGMSPEMVLERVLTLVYEHNGQESPAEEGADG
jgi:cytidylate kinase